MQLIIAFAVGVAVPAGLWLLIRAAAAGEAAEMARLHAAERQG